MRGLNRCSLERAQAALWMVVVFAILLTTAEWNLALPPGTVMPPDVVGPFDIAIPVAVLTALGLPLFSALAAPALVTIRGDTTPAATGKQLAAASDRIQALTGRTPGLQASGQVVSNKDVGSASWQELLTGDEVGTGCEGGPVEGAAGDADDDCRRHLRRGIPRGAEGRRLAGIAATEGAMRCGCWRSAMPGILPTR